MCSRCLRTPGRGDAGADRRCAHVDLADQRLRLAEPVHILEDGVREGVELLAERHRNGVLELSPSHLDVGAELLALVQKRGGERDHRQLEIADAGVKGELHRRRVYVVGRLAEIEMIVRVNDVVVPALLAEDLERAVGHDFVCVHVGRSAGAALYHVDAKMLVVEAIPYFAGSP